MQLTEMFKFWLLPRNIVDVDSFFNGSYTETRGRPRTKEPKPKKEKKLFTGYVSKWNGDYHEQIKSKNKERDLEFIELYKQGKSLQDIGTIYGFTREHIRQRLKINGLTRIHGGRSIKTFLNTSSRLIKLKEKNERMEKRCFDYYGCSLEFRNLYGDHNKYGTLPMAFKTQKNSARTRGINWDLTFPQWLNIWQESGNLANRGIGSGKYVMARTCDMGGYEIGNVEIITHNQNSKDCRAMDKVLNRKLGGGGNSKRKGMHKDPELFAMLNASGINYQTYWQRVRRGMGKELAATTPLMKIKN
jgi:hypothetical protein